MFHVEHFLAYIFLAIANASTFLKPRRFKTFAHSDIVAQLVITSSTITIWVCLLILANFRLITSKAPLIFSALSSFVSLVCVPVFLVRLNAFKSLMFADGNAFITEFAISSLWL